MNNENNINRNIIDFWNNATCLTDEQKQQEKNNYNEDYTQLAPSKKLYDAVSELGKCNSILDYGCGSGWASIIAAKSGCKKVTAVDIGDNIIDSIIFYTDLYGVKSQVEAFSVTKNWLNTIAPTEEYDGLVCSNVLDVVPLNTSKEILKGIAKVTKTNAIIIIGLNFYMSKEMAKQRNIELVDEKYLFVNDVLRLSSLSDEEWIQLLSQYFKIEKLDHFAWEGEPKETRRLFVLRKI